MRNKRSVWAAAAVSVGAVGAMLVAAPTAFAATSGGNAAHTSEGAARSVVVLPADDRTDYEKGYRHGYKDGFRDGQHSCEYSAKSRRGDDRERGYRDGYNAGFAAGRRTC